ncbi:hypothetical protein BT93_C0778 [Corymbia citriodora subsp. variegata]|nr:hypothetical protein BT93_C0778 [Corymbia citriodora subsp. variegata]
MTRPQPKKRERESEREREGEIKGKRGAQTPASLPLRESERGRSTAERGGTGRAGDRIGSVADQLGLRSRVSSRWSRPKEERERFGGGGEREGEESRLGLGPEKEFVIGPFNREGAGIRPGARQKRQVGGNGRRLSRFPFDSIDVLGKLDFRGPNAL